MIAFTDLLRRTNPLTPEYGGSAEKRTAEPVARTRPDDGSITSAIRATTSAPEKTSRYRAHVTEPYGAAPQISPSGVRSNLASVVSRTRIRSGHRRHHVSSERHSADEQQGRATLRGYRDERVPNVDQQRRIQRC